MAPDFSTGGFGSTSWADGDIFGNTDSMAMDDASNEPEDFPAAAINPQPLDSSQPPNVRKRTRAGTSKPAATYPRRRALAACQLCRIRKIKCNNARPTCGSCQTSGARCVYEDTQDISSFDSTSLVILGRLSRIEKRLNQLPEALSKIQRTRRTGRPESGSPQSPPVDLGDQGSIPPTPGGPVSVSPEQPRLDDHIAFDDMRIPPERISPDAVLAWPILESRYPPNYLIDSVFEAELSENDDQGTEEPGWRHAGHRHGGPSAGFSHGVSEDEIPELVRRFLTLVYSKNPILDIDTLWKYVDRMAETGITWDAATCLVLLVCALGCIAQPFRIDESSVPAGPGPRMATSGDADDESLRRARGYYRMARRRFGLLETGILAPQCYFLAGVYTMYTMSPVKAWYLFDSASRACHVYLMCEARRQHQGQTAGASARRSLEQRIYWSCYKSECELRVDMNLPNSCLASLDYPDLFPRPPAVLVSWASDAEAPPSTDSASPFAARRIYENEEQTWYYYLTELTLRRIQNRLCNALYTGDHTSWCDENMPFLLKTVKEFAGNFEKWYAEMPDLLRFSPDASEALTGELPYLCEARAVETQTLLYRPFLYYAIHSRPDAPYRAVVQPLVDKALGVHTSFLKLAMTRHRTHGTWYGLRESTAAVLVLLAAARCGTVTMPSGWRDSVVTCVEGMYYWQDEVPGVERAIQVIQEYLILDV